MLSRRKYGRGLALFLNWVALVLVSLGVAGAQPVLRTEVRNGEVRAVVRHASGEQVTDDAPAHPGETLTVAGEGFAEGAQIWVAGTPVDTTLLDEATAVITLPANAGGSFVEISLAEGNAATVPVDAAADSVQLSAAEVQALVNAAALAAEGPNLAVVVVDRAGRVLAIFRRAGASDAVVEKALSLARTGAFFSNQGTPLSSRTVRAISRVNFPEGIPNQPAGALFGIENTNRGCDLHVNWLPGQLYPRLLNAAGTSYGAGMATVPGGLPLFRDGVTVVGGIGVAGLPGGDQDEFAAVSAALAAGLFVKLPLPEPGAVYIDGFRLPFVIPAATSAAASLNGTYDVAPRNGAAAADGWLVGPLAGGSFTADEVRKIVQNALDRASLTRAAIRLPLGSRTRMVISVADMSGNILAIYRMPDSTIFSIDVALTKARNVVYFAGPNRDARDLPGIPMGTAVSNRTIGFGSQTFFPSGIWNSKPGPFADMYAADLAAPCTQGHQAANENQSGIVFFPGSSPLYRNGQLVGGLGVSGDGVEQDDYVTAGGTQGYEAPAAMRADQVFLRGVRLPYWKFPRNPEQ
ncbi:MAG: heme-binding protein [Candidatus Solibacter sp.]